MKALNFGSAVGVVIFGLLLITASALDDQLEGHRNWFSGYVGAAIVCLGFAVMPEKPPKKTLEHKAKV